MTKRRYFSYFAPTLLLAALLTVLPRTAHASSAHLLSPALQNLASEACMVKSGLIFTDVCFDKSDFDHGVGCSVDEITITALPPQASGTLMIGNAPAAVNQSVSAANLNYLRFIPASGCLESTFRFKAEGEYSMACAIRFVTSVNYAPTTAGATAAVSLWTQRDISVYGTLMGNDPEGDPLTFEITEYPTSGLLSLTNTASGDYKYTPYDGFTGTDAFTYVVSDAYGNYSAPQTVKVEVETPVTELVFADMDEHWAHNAALVMVAGNAMDIKSEGGRVYFKPDEQMNRENFLVTVMKALGAGEVKSVDTVFADNARISEENRGYIARAYELGVIRGISENGKLYFKPENPITRAEAAVILNAIIGADSPNSVPVFADNSDVPAWAKSSLYALNSEGIMNGTGSGYLSPAETLNRAQTAQMLLTIQKLYE